MLVRLPEPDGVIQDHKGGETPVWRCPECQELLTIDEFGWRKRDDIHQGQDVWHKQSWCRECRGN